MRIVAWISALCLIATASLPCANAQDRALGQAAAQTEKGKMLLQILKSRKSSKEYSDKDLTAEQVASVLWAADGRNREQGGRTAPSAISAYPVELYVVLPEGIYLYLPAEHSLRLVASGDHRSAAGTQDFAQKTPLNLVYVANLEKFQQGPRKASGPREDLLNWAALEAGCISQNVYLYCAAEGLATVVRVSVNKDAFAKAAGLPSHQTVIAAQTVGYAP